MARRAVSQRYHHLAVLAAWCAALVLLHSAQAVEDVPLPRPGDAVSQDCGGAGASVCHFTCTEERDVSARPAWCPRYELLGSGCQPGLTRVVPTPSYLDQGREPPPDLCFALPEPFDACGTEGAPCCLTPEPSGEPDLSVRAFCQAGLACELAGAVANLSQVLPYGGRRHLDALLDFPGSSGLLQTRLMGVCRPEQPGQRSNGSTSGSGSSNSTSGGSSSSTSTSSSGGSSGGSNLRTAAAAGATAALLGSCAGRERCPHGSYCAANADHQLGGERCVPLPACGGAGQVCCPPNAQLAGHDGGHGVEPSIVDGRTPMPFCTEPGAACVWASSVEWFDPAAAANGVLLPPSDRAALSLTLLLPEARCLPGLARCGGPGQPCCPHAQFSSSNQPFYFRMHTCDAGLRCNETISLFGERPVLGVCEGTPAACGRLGEPCCRHVDAAGWEWATCNDGQPGAFCAPNNTCSACPAGRSALTPAASAALRLPGVGNVC